MIFSYFNNPYHVLLYFKVFIAISLFVSSLQHIINYKQFGMEGLLPWPLLKKKPKYRKLKHQIFDIIFGVKGFLYLNILRIILLPLMIANDSCTILLLLVVLSFAIYLRAAPMVNAADQMNNIGLTGLLINKMFSPFASPGIIIIFFCFLLIISYFTSGLLKVHEEKWLNGYYLKMTLISRNSENLPLLRMIDQIPIRFFSLSSKIVVGWQVTSFIMPFLPHPIFYIYLGIGIIFHVCTGLFMGLNNFIWTFTAYLPCLIYVNSIL